jgi:hypothetical protein
MVAEWLGKWSPLRQMVAKWWRRDVRLLVASSGFRPPDLSGGSESNNALRRRAPKFRSLRISPARAIVGRVGTVSGG